MKIFEKLRMLVGLVYDGKQQRLAEDVGVNPSTVKRWLDGSEIGSSSLGVLYKKGINISWLLDEHDNDIQNMFADNDAGNLLKEKYFGSKIAGTISDKEKNIRESIEAARVEFVGIFPQQAGEAILKYDRLKAAATPQAPKGKKRKGE